MGALLSLLPTILKLAPGIVAAVEKLLPKASGTDKKSAAVTLLQELLVALEVLKVIPDVDEAAVAELLGRFIDDVVAAKNLFGEFKHKAA